MKIPVIQWLRTYWGGPCCQRSSDIPCSSCSTILQIFCCHLMGGHGLDLHQVLLCQVLLKHLASSMLNAQTTFLISLFLLHFHCFSMDISRVLSNVFKGVQGVQSCVDSATEALPFCFKGVHGVQNCTGNVLESVLVSFYVTGSCSSGIQLAFH